MWRYQKRDIDSSALHQLTYGLDGSKGRRGKESATYTTHAAVAWKVTSLTVQRPVTSVTHSHMLGGGNKCIKQQQQQQQPRASVAAAVVGCVHQSQIVTTRVKLTSAIHAPE